MSCNVCRKTSDYYVMANGVYPLDASAEYCTPHLQEGKRQMDLGDGVRVVRLVPHPGD